DVLATHRGQREAHAVQADGTLLHDEGGQVARDLQAHHVSLTASSLRATFGDRRDRIHVPLHEVAVEPGAEDHRPLEVDPVPDTQVAEGAAAQALRDDVEGDAVPLRTGVGDRQAHPVDGDRGTVGG